jgi:Phospholipase_D-nuclease N-terminal
MNATRLIILGGVLFWLFTCWAVFDIARKDFGAIEKKTIWGFIALLPFLGPILYIVFGFKKGTPKSRKPAAADGGKPV